MRGHIVHTVARRPHPAVVSSTAVPGDSYGSRRGGRVPRTLRRHQPSPGGCNSHNHVDDGQPTGPLPSSRARDGRRTAAPTHLDSGPGAGRGRLEARGLSSRASDGRRTVRPDSASWHTGSATLAFPVPTARGQCQGLGHGMGRRPKGVETPKPAGASPRPSRSRQTPLGGAAPGCALRAPGQRCARGTSADGPLPHG